MADALTAISDFITSPPGQLTAGAVLAGVVWKLFDKIESVIRDQTKRDIARWLQVKSFESGILNADAATWPITFTRMFRRVFGEQHLSLNGFSRSLITTISISICWAPIYAFVSAVGYFGNQETLRFMIQYFVMMAVLSVLVNVLPDYLSIGETRLVLKAMSGTQSAIIWLLLLVVDFAATLSSAVLTSTIWVITSQQLERLVTSQWFVSHEVRHVWFGFLFSGRTFEDLRITSESGGVTAFLMLVLPSILTSLWLWLYCASGFLLKAARRFDVGFAWFNRKVDIEKKPLSAIGLVAGCIVALLWWGVVLVRMVA